MYNHHGHRGGTTSHHTSSINSEMESHNQSDQRSLDREGLDHMRLPFAYKLHILLGDMESSDCEHIISWVEDGKAFKIHNKEKFEDLIQPRYFRQSKLSSFIRQVSALWHVYYCYNDIYFWHQLSIDSRILWGCFFHDSATCMDFPKWKGDLVMARTFTLTFAGWIKQNP